MSQSDLTANYELPNGAIEWKVRSSNGVGGFTSDYLQPMAWLNMTHPASLSLLSKTLRHSLESKMVQNGKKKQMHKRLAVKAKQLNMTITMCIEVAISRYTTYIYILYNYAEKWCL